MGGWEGGGEGEVKEEYVGPVPYGSSVVMSCPEECALKQSPLAGNQCRLIWI